MWACKPSRDPRKCLGMEVTSDDDLGSERCTQTLSLLSPAPPLLPEASPPERRAALELRKAPLRAAPPEGGLYAPLHPPDDLIAFDH